jgi:hypothetical protein
MQINNLETLTTLGTQDTGRRQTKKNHKVNNNTTQKTEKRSKGGPPKRGGGDRGCSRRTCNSYFL